MPRIAVSRLDAWIAVAIAVLTLAIYLQTWGHAFLVMDDGIYIYDNPPVAGGLTSPGVAWAFRAFHAGNWHPLTWISHMVDVELFGLDAGAHHLVNVLLHLASSLLLFAFFRTTTGTRWPSAFAAALFAVHPLHVESVAWAAERKDTLSTLFAILCLIAYARWAATPSPVRYALAFAALAAGLLAKPMLVTLPAALLLVDLWPLGRIEWNPGDGSAALGRALWPRVREKLPLFGLAVASAISTIAAQRAGGAFRDLADSPLAGRVQNALASSLGYLERTFWPVDLAIYYPLPRGGVPAARWILGAVVVGSLLVVAVRRAGRQPWLPVGIFWFFGTLLPVLGLLQVGAQAMADRYHYIPSIGLFAAIAWSVAAIHDRAGAAVARAVVTTLAVASVGALAVAAHAQAAYWRDDETIFRHALAVTKDNLVIEVNLGHTLSLQGRYAEAIPHYERAIAIWPGFFEALFNLGGALDDLGRPGEAVVFYQRAVTAQPSSALARMELAKVLAELGRREEALAALRRAVELAPGEAETHARLGRLLAESGDAQAAEAELRRAIELDPANAEALEGLGLLRLGEGDAAGSLPHFRAALRAEPTSAAIRANLARARRALEPGA